MKRIAWIAAGVLVAGLVAGIAAALISDEREPCPLVIANSPALYGLMRELAPAGCYVQLVPKPDEPAEWNRAAEWLRRYDSVSEDERVWFILDGGSVYPDSDPIPYKELIGTAIFSDRSEPDRFRRITIPPCPDGCAVERLDCAIREIVEDMAEIPPFAEDPEGIRRLAAGVKDSLNRIADGVDDCTDLDKAIAACGIPLATYDTRDAGTMRHPDYFKCLEEALERDTS